MFQFVIGQEVIVPSNRPGPASLIVNPVGPKVGIHANAKFFHNSGASDSAVFLATPDAHVGVVVIEPHPQLD